MLAAGHVSVAYANAADPDIERIRAATGLQLSRDPENRRLRFAHAQASFQTGEFDAAKFHLRYLLRGSRSEVELRQLQEAYATVAKASPWSFGVNFSILPSTNINRTSSNEIFVTPLGTFRITEGGVEESGVGFRIGGRVAYETPLPSGATLTYGAEINRAQYPTDRLNAFDGTVRVTWGQYTTRGATQVTPFVQRFVYDVADDESANSTRYGLRVSHEYYLSRESSVIGSLSAARQDYDDRDFLDGPVVQGGLTYLAPFAEDYRVKLSASLQSRRPRAEHLRYIGAAISGEVTRPVKGLGQFGINLGLSMREYDGDFPALDEPRSDRGASIGASFQPQRLRVFGSAPKLSCRVQQNWSNVALYDFQFTDCAVTFQRVF